MQTGPMRQRLTIQRDLGTARGPDGDHVQDWQTVATVWAEGGPLSGRELWLARQVLSDVTHKFTVRYQTALDDLTGSVRVLWRDRVLHVRPPTEPEGRKIELVLECTEAADASRFLQDETGQPVTDEGGQLILEP
jgi:SPP1 family predicted phage head-tail adaptor